MKYLMQCIIFLIFLFYSCTQAPISSVLQKPSSQWSIHECRSIIASATKNNFRSTSKVAVIVTPFTPAVVTALGRIHQQKKLLGEQEYGTLVEELIFRSMGLYYYKIKDLFVDKQGNFYRGDIREIDSVLLLITIKNKTWPCVSPTVITLIGSGKNRGGVMYSLYGENPADWPCYFPDISDLEDRIFLQKEGTEIIKPRFVWGRRYTILNREETLLAMFPLCEYGKSFNNESQRIYLVITGFEDDVKIELDFTLNQRPEDFLIYTESFEDTSHPSASSVEDNR